MDVILFLVFWFVCAFLHYVLWMSYFGGKYPQFRALRQFAKFISRIRRGSAWSGGRDGPF